MNPMRNVFVCCVLLLPAAAAAQEEKIDIFADPQNLKVLPEDISSADLSETMKNISMALGARCETCHVGEPRTPLHTFDFASDDKDMKQKARLMLDMVNQINDELVPRLNDVESADRVAVRCVTCHRGLPQPRLIQDVLDTQLADNGLDAAVSEYKSLRDKYFGSHSYDFSEYTLPMYAENLAAGDHADDAIALAELNEIYFPESFYTVFALAELYAATEQSDLALAKYTRALEIDPRAERFIGPRIAELRGD